MTEQRQVNPWIVAIAVMFGTFMEVLDTTVVNVSLPHIAATMSATIDEATWVLTSYLVANAIILPMTGWLAAKFGRKRLLMLSTGGFTIASFLCGAAPNLASLIIFRIIQGATGGALQPLSQAMLLESFKPEERGRAQASESSGEGETVATASRPGARVRSAVRAARTRSSTACSAFVSADRGGREPSARLRAAASVARRPGTARTAW